MATAAPAKIRERFTIKFDREADGRWIAEVPQLPGVIVYGASKQDARVKAQALALRVLADRIENEKTARSHVSFA